MKAFVCIFFSLFSITGVYALSLDVGTTEFDAVGNPDAVRIHGEGGKVEGSLKETKGKISGELTVKLDALTTNKDLRDKHMREKYLQIAKYPTAVLKFKDVDSSDGSHPFSGDLTLKGITKKIKGTVKIATDGKTKTARAEFSINLDDFKIGVPSFLGVTVAKEVNILVDLKAH